MEIKNYIYSIRNFYYIESETVLREDKELYEYAVYSFF